MEKTVQEIVQIEWEMLGRLQNIGGRAVCQDSPRTFACMRGSQLSSWTPEMRESYLRDLTKAREEGRNLLWEKYARMMERTHPQEYRAIQDRLPQLQPEQVRLAKQICKIHVVWQEALAKRYPRLTGRGRSIRKETDRSGNTSFETYLQSELLTYSPQTLCLYAAYVTAAQKRGKNVCEEILCHMVRDYGYPGPAEAEKALEKNSREGK